MGWQTSRAFFSSLERIEKILEIPVISGYQTSGAVVKFASKEDFPVLASLTEGGFATDFELIKNDRLKKMLLPGISKGTGDTGGDIDRESRKRDSGDNRIDGIIGDGQSHGCNAFLDSLDDKEVLVFWYNGHWNVVKRDTAKDEHIPVALAKKVVESAGMDGEAITGKLTKTQLKNTDYESVSAKDMAKLMGMDDELYGSWEYENILHIMLNTHMFNGPYQLRRRGGEIKISFFPAFEDDSDYISFNGLTVKGLASLEYHGMVIQNYFGSIMDGFKKWRVTDPPKSADEVKGLGNYTINVQVEIEYQSQKKKNTNTIRLINTYDPFTKTLQISNVKTPNWKINNVGAMTMYSFYGDDSYIYEADEYRWIAAHEFAHLLGIGDATGVDGTNIAKLSDEIPEGDIMRGGKVITYNSVEMIFMAALKNEKQEFTDSEAITDVKTIGE